jgi:HAD superfamily hydrolase (TIGR01549 family)
MPFQDGRLNALVFDIDGTLYRQGPLRRAMLMHLLGRHLGHPVRGWQTMKVLRAYRHAQESLRAGTVTSDIAAAQITLTCDRTLVDRGTVIDWVTRWMEQEPLRFLPRCLQPGLIEFLQTAKKRGLRLGVLSDYPAESKLEALGLSGIFDVVLSAQAPEVNVFKPDPRGLLVAMERLGAARADSLYIGDRVDVDAAMADAAGVRCAIVTGRRSPDTRGHHIQVANFSQLGHLLWQ